MISTRRSVARLAGLVVLSTALTASTAYGQDFNADGTPDEIDVVLGFDPGGVTAGSVTIRSGIDNAVLFETTGAEADDGFGWDVQLLPDLTGDGIREVAVAAPRSHLWSDSIGRVFVHSGATGDPVFVLRGEAGDRIGFELGVPEDVNADGVADIFVTGMRLDPIGTPVHRHFWFSGATGEMLFDQYYPIPGVKPVLLVPLDVRGDLNASGTIEVGDILELDAQIGENAPPQEGGDLNEDLATDDTDLDLLTETVVEGEPAVTEDDLTLTTGEWADLSAVMETWATLYPEDPATAQMQPEGWTGGFQTFNYWNNGQFQSNGESLTPPTMITVCEVEPIEVGQRSSELTEGCECDALVEILTAPELVHLGEPFTVTAAWGPDCDERWWTVQVGTMVSAPIYADTLNYTVEFMEGWEDSIVVKAYCRDIEGQCRAIDTRTIDFDDCSLDLAGCPWEVIGGDQVTLNAVAVPLGGTYTWTLTSESCFVQSVQQRNSTFKFTLKDVPTCGQMPGLPLYLTATVTYEYNGCVKQRVCIFPARFDTDQDGLYDDEESLLDCPSAFEADTDGDGLNDGAEVGLGLDPCDTDSDDDGASDSCELSIPGEVITGTSDQDHDQLKDKDECVRGTNPLNRDTDDDGIKDGVEVQYGWDPLNPDDPEHVDEDDDGLNDLVEVLIYHTDPADPDVDDDGLLDGDEVTYMSGLDVFNPDTDGDGLLDGAEINLHSTQAWQYDTDGDGLSDGFEVRLGEGPGLDPLDDDSDGDGTSDSNEDSDGDGLDNGEEQFWGSSASSGDTDSDGVSDGSEAVAGDPTDPDIVGAADSDQTYEVTVHASANNGEGSWVARIGNRTLDNTGYGGETERTVRLPLGVPHVAKLTYAGTEPAFFRETCRHDFAYCLDITPIGDPYVCTIQVEDPESLLVCDNGEPACYDTYECNEARGKEVTVRTLKQTTRFDGEKFKVDDDDLPHLFPGEVHTIHLVLDGMKAGDAITVKAITPAGVLKLQEEDEGPLVEEITFDDDESSVMFNVVGLKQVGGSVALLTVTTEESGTGCQFSIRVGGTVTAAYSFMPTFMPTANTAYGDVAGVSSWVWDAVRTQPVEDRSWLAVTVLSPNGEPLVNTPVAVVPRDGYVKAYDGTLSATTDENGIAKFHLAADASKIAAFAGGSIPAGLGHVRDNLFVLVGTRAESPGGDTLDLIEDAREIQLPNMRLMMANRVTASAPTAGNDTLEYAAGLSIEVALTNEALTAIAETHLQGRSFTPSGWATYSEGLSLLSDENDGEPQFSEHAYQEGYLLDFASNATARLFYNTSMAPHITEALRQLQQEATYSHPERGPAGSSFDPPYASRSQEEGTEFAVSAYTSSENGIPEEGTLNEVEVRTLLQEFALGFVPGYDAKDVFIFGFWKNVFDEPASENYVMAGVSFFGLLSDAGYIAPVAGFMGNGITSGGKAILKFIGPSRVKAVLRFADGEYLTLIGRAKASVTQIAELMAKFPKPPGFSATNPSSVITWAKQLSVGTINQVRRAGDYSNKLADADIMAAFQALRRNTSVETIGGIDAVVGVGGFIKYVDDGAATFDSISSTLATSVGGAGAVADDALEDLALSTAATLRRGAGPDGLPNPDDLRSVREAALALPLGIVELPLRHVASPHIGTDKAFRSWEEFQYARFVTAPIQKHRDALIAMRNHPDIWPVPTGTKMQKVIPADKIAEYIDLNHFPRGFIAREADAGTGVFSTSGSMIDGLALPADTFSDRTAVGIVEWDLIDSDDVSIPFSPHFGGTTVEAEPFTGNGFTRNGDKLIPESIAPTGTRPINGRLYRLDSAGNKTLIALFNGSEWVE